MRFGVGMQTLVVYVAAGNGLADAAESAHADGVRSLEAHYDRLWSQHPVRRESIGPSTGMVLWEAEETPSRWPSWTRREDQAVASLYAPLGYEQVTGAVAIETAPHVLVERLRRAPKEILAIAAPFVCAGLDSVTGNLDIFTDAVGIGRLFEVRSPQGWVWSNRPVAALLFAGVPIAPDHEGWLRSAVADEFFGASTPYAGVRALEPATHVHWDGQTRRRSVSSVDTCASWIPALDGTEPNADLVDAAAADLTRMAASIGRLYSGVPTVDLTGGRDSRLVAAAFLASETDIVLHTHDAVPGDLEIARRLVEMLPEPVAHRIRHVATGGQVAPPRLHAVASARRWHDYAEGLRPSTYLAHRAPAHLDAVTQVAIGGVGGEAAHGFFYPPALKSLEQLPLNEQLDAFSAYVVSRQAPVAGASPEARARVRASVDEILRRIASWGVRGGTILDQYYVLQRMRRWGTTGERLGTVSPLLASSFLTAALAVSPEDRSSSRLHRELTRRLLPRWGEVPYLSDAGTPRAAPSRRAGHVVRLGDAEDRSEIEAVLADTQDWGSAFETSEVHRLWHLSADGGTTAAQERILRSALWRGAFTDHIAGMPAGEPRTRAHQSVPRTSETESVQKVARRTERALGAMVSKTLRRALQHPVVKDAARSRTWERTRDTGPGRAVRSAVKKLR